MREAKPDQATKVKKLGIFAESIREATDLVHILHALEAGRYYHSCANVTRDVPCHEARIT